MSRKKPQVYIALSEFCQSDTVPMERLVAAGFEVRRNSSGHRLKRDEMVAAIGNAEAVIAALEPYDAAILNDLPRLRCISRCGIGTDSIDLAAAERRGIAVLTTPDEVAEPAAQLTLAMILALARNLSRYSVDGRDRLWRRYEGHLLSEWTIGIVGFGRIGRRLEGYLRPFGCRILVTDPVLERKDVESHIELQTLEQLLNDADVVSLHVSRHREEGALMDAHAFARMKAGSRFVNTARGYLVDETALYDALKRGHLAGAALDVYEEEPYAGPLLSLPQVICTPHVATMTAASRRAMELRAAENVVAFLRASS
jgi:D-3-phosphoglycerate dehydrogenase